MTASTTPSDTPISMEKTVSRMVPRSPSSTGVLNITWSLSTNDHSKCLLVTRKCTNIATSRASAAIAAQRPGRRTGTALIGSGRARSTVVTSVLMTTRNQAEGLDGRGGDGAGGHAPLVKDLLV